MRSFVFWGEFEDTKSPFEIISPLGDNLQNRVNLDFRVGINYFDKIQASIDQLLVENDDAKKKKRISFTLEGPIDVLEDNVVKSFPKGKKKNWGKKFKIRFGIKVLEESGWANVFTFSIFDIGDDTKKHGYQFPALFLKVS